MVDGTPSQDVKIEVAAGSHPGITIVKVSGPLTIRNFFDFQDLTRQQSVPLLLIDFTHVPYIDSAALGSLLGLHVSCGRTNRKYALVNVNERLRVMFTVSGVQDILVMFPSAVAAEAALA